MVDGTDDVELLAPIAIPNSQGAMIRAKVARDASELSTPGMVPLFDLSNGAIARETSRGFREGLCFRIEKSYEMMREIDRSEAEQP